MSTIKTITTPPFLKTAFRHDEEDDQDQDLYRPLPYTPIVEIYPKHHSESCHRANCSNHQRWSAILVEDETEPRICAVHGSSESPFEEYHPPPPKLRKVRARSDMRGERIQHVAVNDAVVDDGYILPRRSYVPPQVQSSLDGRSKRQEIVVDTDEEYLLPRRSYVPPESQVSSMRSFVADLEVEEMRFSPRLDRDGSWYL